MQYCLFYIKKKLYFLFDAYARLQLFKFRTPFGYIK